MTGLKLVTHLFFFFVICMPRYVSVFLTATPQIKETQQFLMDIHSHLSMLRFRPEVLVNAWRTFKATKTWEESFKNSAVSSAS